MTASGVSAVSGRVSSAFPTASDHNFPLLKIAAEMPIFLERFSNSELSAFEKALSSVSLKRANDVNDSNSGAGVLIIGTVVVVGGVVVVGTAVSEVALQETSKAKEIKREIFLIDNDHFFSAV